MLADVRRRGLLARLLAMSLADRSGGLIVVLNAHCLLAMDSTGNLNKKCRAEGNSPSLTWSVWLGGYGGGDGACIQPRAKIK